MTVVANEIFISYRLSDEPRARLFYNLLKERGVEAWYDAKIQAGEDWRTTTANAPDPPVAAAPPEGRTSEQRIAMATASAPLTALSSLRMGAAGGLVGWAFRVSMAANLTAKSQPVWREARGFTFPSPSFYRAVTNGADSWLVEVVDP